MTTPLFEITRGDDFTFRVTITDVMDVPLDITGWQFMATMKLDFMKPDEGAPVKVDIGPLEGADAQAGLCYLQLPSDQTKDLLPAVYFFDLQRVFNGKVTTVLNGRVRVNADVTQRTA